MEESKKLHKYLQGDWNPLRVKIARAILQYPILEDNTRGEKYSSARIAADVGETSPTSVNRIHYALMAGAVPPTDEELALAEEAKLDIPMNPMKKPKPKPEPDEEAQKEITGVQMQAGVNQFLENIETGKALPKPVDKKNGGQKAEEVKPLIPKPLIPGTHNLKPSETAAEAKVEEAKVETKAEESKQKIMAGGGLFESVHKVKLTLGTLFWHFYCINVWGFDGTIDDFLNWCVADCIKARGWSLDVIEDPFGLMKKEDIKQGDGDGARK